MSDKETVIEVPLSMAKTLVSAVAFAKATTFTESVFEYQTAHSFLNAEIHKAEVRRAKGE